MKWTVEILNKTAQKELNSLPKDLKAKFLHISEMLEEFGPQNVRKPFVKSIVLRKEKLWEMRMKGISGIARSIYALVKDKRIIILHTFIKKTQKTPHRAIELAVKRLKEVKNDQT